MSRLDRGNGLCKNGHVLAEVGISRHSTNGSPQCRECNREKQRAYAASRPKPVWKKPRPIALDLDWFKARAAVGGPDECWPWLRCIDPRGYGRGRQQVAHRLAYINLIGPVPEGMTLDHLCHTNQCRLGDDCPHRRCINPAHLDPVPLGENVARTAARTECRSGHDASKHGAVKPSGQRYCRECNKERCRARRERQEAA